MSREPTKDGFDSHTGTDILLSTTFLLVFATSGQFYAYTRLVTEEGDLELDIILSSYTDFYWNCQSTSYETLKIMYPRNFSNA